MSSSDYHRRQAEVLFRLANSTRDPHAHHGIPQSQPTRVGAPNAFVLGHQPISPAFILTLS
jgi:hypothetical protein